MALLTPLLEPETPLPWSPFGLALMALFPSALPCIPAPPGAPCDSGCYDTAPVPPLGPWTPMGPHWALLGTLAEKIPCWPQNGTVC